jgi:hypothetical protein
MPFQRDQSRPGRSGCLRKLATSVLDALHQYREHLRGIAIVASQTGKDELATLDRSAWSEFSWCVREVAAGIAQVNALANLGAFAGSDLLGVIKDATGSYPLALLPLVALSAAGSIAVLLIGHGQPRIVAAAGAAHH